VTRARLCCALSFLIALLFITVIIYGLPQARIQEKLKHAEEKAISEKEENYQKLKAVEALHKESNQITAKLTAEKQELCANVSQLETRISDLQEEHKKQTEALVRVSSCIEKSMQLQHMQWYNDE